MRPTPVTLPPLGVLIVDDNPDDSDLLRMYLRRDPSRVYDVATAQTGTEALALCRTAPPDCLVLDYHLPDMDAVDVLDALEDGDVLTPIPVLVVTGSADEATAIGAIRAGAEDYVVKDRLNAETLRIAVHGAIERHRLRRQIAANEERLSVMARLSPVGLFRTDAQGHCVYVNERWSAIADLVENDALDMGWARAIHPDDRERVFAEWYAAARENRDFHSEYRFLREDGTITWVLGQAAAEHDAAGSTVGFIGTITDITERKQAEAALAESEERYRTLMERISQGFCILEMLYDADGRAHDYRFLEVNPTFARHTGLHDALGKRARELVPDLEDRWIEVYARVAESGEPYRFEQGSEAMDRWFEVEAVRVGGEQSRKVALLFADVTERRRLERQLRENDERLRLAVEVAGFAIAEINYTTDVSSLSAEAASLFGLGEEAVAVPRARVHATFHPDDRDRLMGLIQESLDPAGQGGFAAEHRVLQPGGRVRWLSVRKQVFFDRSGATARPLRGILAALEITGQKEIALELERRQREFESLVEHAPDVVARFDRDLRHLYVNPAVEAITGISPAAYLGKSNAELGMPPELVTRWKTLSEAAFATGEEQHFEFTFPAQDTLRHFRARLVPEQGGDGSIETLLAIIYDVTERARAEADRQALLDVLAHDLKNPLTVLKLQADLLARQIARQGIPDVQVLSERVAGFTELATRMTELVDAISDQARYTMGTEIALERRTTDFVALTGDVLDGIRRLGASHALRLETSEAELIGEWDTSAVRRVVQNLLDNALKYSPDGGEVVVRLRREHDAAVLEVQDQGIGIPAPDVPHIFDFRHRAGNVGAIAGSGIGLAGVKQIVARHGGTLAVASAEGVGSTFTVRLPLAQPDQTPQRLGSATGQAHHGKGDHPSPS